MSDLKICHLSSVHPRFDIRIFLKECCSLASFGYQVSLIVADGKGYELISGISIFDVGISRGGRFARIFKTTRRVFKKALMLNAYVYHFHDPELIPIGLKLKKMGKKVVFDSHEDLPKQLLGKPYLNRPLRWALARLYKQYEKRVCLRFDAVVGATPSIRDKFLKINPLSIDISNYPISGELEKGVEWNSKCLEVCYVGGITGNRGIREIVKAMAMVKSAVRLQLCGVFSESEVETDVRGYAGWKKVDAMGFLARSAVSEVMARSVAGLVTFLPIPNHIDAQPNKMFEYMSAGIPVIASHFPLWREIIERNDCGLCVDPLNPKAIAQAIDFLVTHPERAREMGENGRLAVKNRYNWKREEGKLLGLYKTLGGIT